MAKHLVGIDLGGTKIECAVLDSDHNIIYRERGATPALGTADDVCRAIEAQYRLALDATGIGAHSLGLGTPGSINPRTGLLRNSSISSTNGVDFSAMLAQYLGHGIAVANDAQCFALAEAVMGAAAGYDRVFGVIFGTGVGGALIQAGKIQTGANGILGEWGHTSLDSGHHQRCRCGRYGCVESILGGGSIQRRYNPREYELFPNAQSILSSQPAELLQWYSYYGLAMANLIQILDPDCIVLGGGLSLLPDIHSTGLEMINAALFSDAELTTPILSASLGDSAGSIGAALLANI